MSSLNGTHLDSLNPPGEFPQLPEVIREITQWRADLESWKTAVDVYSSLIHQSTQTDDQLRSRSLFDTYMSLYAENTRLDSGADELNDKWNQALEREGADVDEDDALGPEDLEALRAIREDDLRRRVPTWDEINRRYDPIVQDLKAIIVRDDPAAHFRFDDLGIHELCEWKDAVTELCKV